MLPASSGMLEGTSVRPKSGRLLKCSPDNLRKMNAFSHQFFVRWADALGSGYIPVHLHGR